MKKLYFSMLMTALCLTSVEAQEVATFDDLTSETNTYWDGSDLSAMFTSGGYTFINNYVDWGGYGSWDGFAYSTMTANTFQSLDDQYNACLGHGVDNSAGFGVVYYSSYMGTEPTVIENNAAPFEATGCYVTNSAYAYTSMKEGDAYAKKFDETDWFLITATGYLSGEVTGTAEFYLAQAGQILDEWAYFDLSALCTVDEVHFTLSSSDTGMWGMNTPAYFCMDNFGALNPATSLNRINTSTSGQTFDLNGRPATANNGLRIENGRVSFFR